MDKIGKNQFFARQTKMMMLWSEYEPPRDKKATS